MRVLTSSPTDLVRSYLERGEAQPPREDPQHTDVLTLRGAEVAAVYYQVRVAGGLLRILARGRPACCSACSTWPAAARTPARS